MIPVFVLMRVFGWVDSYKALIIPAAFSAYGTFLLRQFFMTIPRDLEDAARIDGCNYWHIFCKVILPLSKTALATLTAAFIRNERLAAEARYSEARARDDEIARQVHRGLLPHGEPTLPGLEISGCCRAAENVGGDYYGYISMPDGSLGLVMADVAGHGVAAALYMAAAKGALQAEARRILSPAELLRRANVALVGDFSASDVFATVFFGRFEPGGRGFEYANGGHNPPLLVRVDGNVDALGPTGPALGFLPGLDYREESRKLEPGDVFVVYTDGLVESRDSKNRLYGMDRLREAVIGCRHLGAAEIRDRLLEELESHCDGKTAHDDVTLVVIRAVEVAP